MARRFARDHRAGHRVSSARSRRLPRRAGAGSSSVARPARDTTLGPEGYRLDVNAGRRHDHVGRSRRRLLRDADAPPAPSARRSSATPPIAGVQWTIPAVTIVDRPRFAWRGMHLDVSRHFMPKEFVKKYIDLLALHKMNSFHWHLTDDQGWRIEIKKYPRLTEVGAWRDSKRSSATSARAIRRSASTTRSRTAASTPRTTCARSSRTRASASCASCPRSRCPATRRRRSPPTRASATSATRSSRVDEVGRHAAHPESVGHDHRVHAGRAHRGDGALSRTVHSHRRRRSDQAAVEGEPARAGQDPRSASRPTIPPTADFQRRERAAELVHHADGHFLTSHRTAPGRLGRDPRGRSRAERRRDVVARHGGRTRRRARRTRRRS